MASPTSELHSSSQQQTAERSRSQPTSDADKERQESKDNATKGEPVKPSVFGTATSGDPTEDTQSSQDGPRAGTTTTGTTTGAHEGTASAAEEGQDNTSSAQPSLLTTRTLLGGSALPPHENIGNSRISIIHREDLALQCLNTGMHFLQKILPTFKAESKPKTLDPNNTKVFISKGKHNGETWIARSSSHEDEANDSSATFDEFRAGLKDNHSKNEAIYTDLPDSVKVAEWPGRPQIDGWADVTVEVYEQLHKLPAGLDKRAFPILVVTGRRQDAEHFIIVQVPVDLTQSSYAKYSNPNKKYGRGVTLGRYASVESVERDSKGMIQWKMATASDARGVLGPFRGLQNMGIPDAIAKDVPLFLKWTIRRRPQD